MKIKKLAFTMAEATIVIIIIGLVATLLISVVRNSITNANRVKLKKAVEMYSSAIIMMLSENKIKADVDSFNNWAKGNNCSNARSYFNIVEGNGCQFKTKDGIWWDIGNNGSITKALVAFKRQDLTKEKATSENTYDAFFLMTQFDGRKSARILDVEYSNYLGYSVNILNNAKVYAFINKDNMENYLNICNGEKKSCIKNQCYTIEGRNYCQSEYYDYNGFWVGYRNICSNGALNCISANKPFLRYEDLDNEYGKAAKGIMCDVQGDDCTEYLSYYSSLPIQKRYIDYYQDMCNNSTLCGNDKLYSKVYEHAGKLEVADGSELELTFFITHYPDCSLGAQNSSSCSGSVDYIAEYHDTTTGTYYQVTLDSIPDSQNPNPNILKIEEVGKIDSIDSGDVGLRQYTNCSGLSIMNCKTCTPEKADCT